MKIKVLAKTKAKQARIEKVDDVTYKVYVKEVPEDGKANEAIISALANYFSIPQSNVQLLFGKTAKQKIFLIL
ncbi:MAG: DUF167 domain-containing protein [Patescibacteria group bacterium]|jgi:hypothetical protein